MKRARLKGMTASVRRPLRILAAVILVIAVTVAVVVSVPGSRSSAVRVLLQLMLAQRGYNLTSGTLTVGTSEIDADDLRIADRAGVPLFSAKRVVIYYDAHELFGNSDRAYGLHAIVVRSPVISVVRHNDGTFNFSKLLSGFGSSNAPAATRPPLRFTLAVRDGRLLFANPTAYAPPGRKFALNAITVNADLAQGTFSRASLTSLFDASGGGITAYATPFNASLYEDDRLAYALAKLTAPHVEIAPLVDGFVSTPNFIVEAGTADVTLSAVDAGYDPATGPLWHLQGVAPLRDGRLRFLPLAVPVRDLNGTLRFNGEDLSLAGVTGTAAGAPITLDGGLRLLGGVQLGLGATLAADLIRMRRLFAFSASLPLSGEMATHVHVDGPPNRLHVRGVYRTAGAVTYQDLTLSRAAGDFYYADGHVTLSRLAARYAGGDIFGGGDIDVWAVDRASAFAFVIRLPASTVPVAANLNPSGLTTAFASLSGPLTRLSGNGFAQVAGGNGTQIRTMVSALPLRLTIGPLVATGDGGEFVLAASVDRPEHGPRTINGDLIADHAVIHLLSGAYGLPGAGALIELPSVDGTFDGAAWVRGPQSAPVVGVNLRTRNLVVAGERLGAVRIAASGAGDAIRIGELSVNGPDANFSAQGYAAAKPSSGRYAAALAGAGAIDLATLPGMPPQLHARGRATGRFSAILAGGRWTVSGDARSANATIAGVPARAIGATVSGGGGRPTQIYASTAQAAGGEFAAIGTLPRAGGADRALSVWGRSIDVRDLRSLGMPLQRGSAVAFANIGGSPSNPTADGVASLTDARYNSIPVSGDMDVRFAGGRLVTQYGRVAFAGNRVAVTGNVAGLGPGALTGNELLDVRASMRVGDLGGLLDPYVPPQVELEGLVAGDLHVSGSVAAPRLDGVIDSVGGSIRGVAFNNMRGVLHVEKGALALDSGEVQLGSSRFTLAGRLTNHSVRLQSTSPHIDLSDFNDFFNGYDTVDGIGTWRVAFASSPTAIEANGSVDLDSTAIVGYPLGSVDARFSSKGDTLLGSVRQRGPADSADVSGSVAFPRRTGGLPDVKSAFYDVRGSVTGVDLGIVMPLIRHEDLGLTGRLDIAGSLRGHLASPSAFATFGLRDGHLGKLPITALSGSLESDGKTFGINDARVELPFAHIAGSAHFGSGGRVVGSAGVDAQDLDKLASAFGRPGIVAGAAKATVSIAGTLQRPRVQTEIAAGKGDVLGVDYESASAKVAYQPGAVEIGDAAVVLGRGRGIVSLTGTLPLQLQPLSLGPKYKPINLHLTAQDVELAAFDSLAGRFGKMTGTLQATASAVGKAGDPVLAGSASLRGASVHSTFETVPLEGIVADLSLAQDTVTLSRFRGSLGSGNVVIRGSAHVVPAVGLRSNAGLQYSTRLSLNSAHVEVPGWLGGTFDGNFSLTKSGANPYLEGSVTARDAIVPFSAIYQLATGFGQGGPAPTAPGPVPGVPAPLPGRTVAYAGGIYGGSFHIVNSGPSATPAPTGFVLPPVDLKVTATAGKRVRVKGGLIDLTAAGEVLVGGNLRAPTLDGSFSSTRGQVTYFDTVFRIDSGIVEFNPATGLLPSLDVRATTNTGGAQITLAIAGRVDRLSTELTSVPTMTRDEIAATLLHAPQVTSLTNSTPAQAQAILTGEAQAFFNAQLTRSLLFPLESFLAESLDVEQINFIFDELGRPAIEVRKLFTPTIYGLYRSTVKLPVTQSFGVAYILRNSASLELLQTQTPTGLSTSTLNLRFSFH